MHLIRVFGGVCKHTHACSFLLLSLKSRAPSFILVGPCWLSSLVVTVGDQLPRSAVAVASTLGTSGHLTLNGKEGSTRPNTDNQTLNTKTLTLGLWDCFQTLRGAGGSEAAALVIRWSVLHFHLGCPMVWYSVGFHDFLTSYYSLD